MKQADREDAFHIISQIRDGFADGASRLHKANEATTRLIIIDEVLNALGWSKDDFNPETKAGQAGYIDYLLSIDRIPRLIIEAKRTGKTFGSPSKNSPRNTYQLRYFRSAFKAPFTQVIKQAQKYALETGIPYAMITNGAEWVLVQLLLTPGYNDINDLRGYYFGNLFSDEFNFELFWEILHKPYVDSGSLESSFAEINIKEADFNRTLGNQFGLLRWQTLEFNQELRYFYDLFFDEIIDPGRRNMLEKCFVTDSRLDQYQGELKRALRDIAPSFIPEAIDITPGEGERLVSQPSGDQKGRVIIVTGRVGCGKSTFVTRVLVKARHDQKESLVALKIDLIDEVENGHQNVTSELWRYITRDWKQTCPDSYHNEVLRKIFGRELSELRKGPYEKVFDHDQMELARHEAELLDRLSRDPDTFFPRCWKYYRKKGKGIVVFLDNADQASEPYQKKVYAFAHKLARETGATVIITMREFTFFRGREAGFLDVRSDDTVFHLKSPDLLQLLSKRIKYIEHYIDEDHRSSDWKKNWDWDRFRQNIRNHSNTLKQVFLVHETGTDFLALLSAIAWHDVRFFLNILRQLHFMLGSEQSPWSRSEIIAALLVPIDRGHSIVGNLYRPPYPAYQCYFLKLRILLMMQHAQLQHETRHGTTLNTLVRFLRQYGYQLRWIRRAVEELVQERFLECLEAPAAEDYTKAYKLQESHSFRPSPLAYECTRYIVTDSVYLSLIGNELPFHQEHSFRKYEEVFGEFYEMLTKQGLDRIAIELLEETDTSRIVASYLVAVLEDEQASRSLAKYMPEVAATERRLEEIARQLRQLAKLQPLPSSTPKQRSLFDLIQTDDKNTEDTNRLPTPKTLMTARIGRSELAPLIFWALVHLRLRGNLLASGVEITEVINQHLVDDYNRKAPNNISRTLRGDIMKAQEWLQITKVSARIKTFGAKSNWPEYWLEIFGEPAPEVEDKFF